MALRISGANPVERNLAKSQADVENSLEKLSSGVKFTKADPSPADRSISERMQIKMKENDSYKRNANEGISLVQTADSALGNVSNMVVRMQELATQAVAPTISDKERKFLFVEYESLYDEINRISKSTAFGGENLLSGSEEEGGKERSVSFRVGSFNPNAEGKDRNQIKLDGLDKVNTTTEKLGIKSVKEFLKNPDGISLDDLESAFESSVDTVSETFQGALEQVSGFRAHFGAVGSRLTHSIDFIDVAQENLAASQSRIRDVDYASEVANLTRANMLVQASSSLMSQTNLGSRVALTLLRGADI
jgi:flagellin